MIKTRIAPSPTGDPHVGTAYIALFNYCFAKKHGGKFIVRIEDTDQTRSAPEYEQGIMRALNWLGIKWDEGPDIGGPCGPYRQSERKAIYAEHAQRLLENGTAYRCFCTSDRLDNLRKRQLALKKPSGYDGLCRELSDAEIQEKLDAGLPYTIRLRMPKEGETIIQDRLRGEIRYPNDQLDDQILIKSDGFPTYHLANVVDDHLMEITHVIRAEEWIPSTPKHLILYKSFGWTPPEFCHMPLLRNPDKSKISKRKNPVSLDYYKRAGILPEAMVNFLAMIGYSMSEDKEKFTLDDLLENFDLSRVSLGEPVFNLEKLAWLNGLYIRDLSEDQLYARIMSDVLDEARIRAAIPLIRERITRLDEFVPMTDFFFNGSLEYDHALLIGKGQDVAASREMLLAVTDELDTLKAWDHTSLEATLRAFCERTAYTTKQLFMPLRIAVTGRKASPPLFESMALIGKPMCQARLREATRRLELLLGTPKIEE
jgi:glutamyl-tRNA synthetase